ncbi:MAG: hypothetical protein KatS3mg051_1571 [Anaerolineae bacterium]|nr:MAG: hypothetical protein KatS3mg051_1571 [Anaerolineae bacterium]
MRITVNRSYQQLFEYRGRYALLYGGAGAGKSVAAAQHMVVRALHTPGLRLLLVRRVHRTIRHSQYQLICDVLAQAGIPYEANRQLLEITLPNDSTFLSAGIHTEDDREKLKSIVRVSGIWVEEATELEREDFDQLDLRMRGESPDGYHQIILTFNPISRDHWLRMFVERSDVLTIRATYRDNAFIDDQYRALLEGLRERDLRLYEVYCLGQWGRPVEGLLFRREWYQEWRELPPDVRGVVYCDPNLSMRLQGDTTAIVHLLYSVRTGYYYVAEAVCRPFARADELLREVLRMRRSGLTMAVGFDGHVSQESHWTEHVRAFCRAEGIAFPQIEYCRYNVDALAKSLQLVMSEGRLFFPPGFDRTSEGARFLEQLWAFEGKKAGRKDDAPDALICAMELIAGRRIAAPIRADAVHAVKDHYAL